MTDKPALVCAWDPYHQNHLPAHGILVCADCERPMLAIELRGSPAVSDDYKPIPMGEPSWTTWSQAVASAPEGVPAMPVEVRDRAVKTHKCLRAKPHPEGPPFGYCTRCSSVVVRFLNIWWHPDTQAPDPSGPKGGEGQ